MPRLALSRSVSRFGVAYCVIDIGTPLQERVVHAAWRRLFVMPPAFHDLHAGLEIVRSGHVRNREALIRLLGDLVAVGAEIVEAAVRAIAEAGRLLDDRDLVLRALRQRLGRHADVLEDQGRRAGLEQQLVGHADGSTSPARCSWAGRSPSDRRLRAPPAAVKTAVAHAVLLQIPREIELVLLGQLPRERAHCDGGWCCRSPPGGSDRAGRSTPTVSLL